MPSTLDSLYEAALALPEHLRADLAERLLDTLPPGTASSFHPVEPGEAEPFPWEEARRRAWTAVYGEPLPHG